MAVPLNNDVRAFIDAHLTTDMRTNGVLDLDKFAKKIGINKIYRAEFNKKDVSGLLKKENGDWNIYVNDKDSARRRRFTIAHEIGHFISYLNGGASKSVLEESGEVSDLAFARAATYTGQME